MYSEALRPGSALGPYPERDHARRNPFEATLHNVLGGLRHWSLNHTRHANQFVSQVNAACAKLENLSDGRFKERVDELRRQIGRAGLDQTRAVEGFALVREAAWRTLGQRHYDTQVLGGWVMLNGMLAEMETGEGKTLTATLTAGIAGLAGIPVHIITANDDLAQRDAELMAPVYKLLGLRVGAVTEQVREADARRQAYACNIT